ncbi:ATP-binding protein [uncultured Pedobacter sp.]|uniref:ATP-binding protein n=1 Tax=uncultured Pedobacter sp. TaxID=246139 RepID=UPI0025DCCDD4|nr:ATP-binding protein [uncultured Pedobacter sp.]
MSHEIIGDELTAEEIEPRPAALIETLRAIGYSLSSAVADIIDNSISAGARNVWVDFNWDSEDSSVSFRDDGGGMSLPQIIEALRPGSEGPMAARGEKDLGRFGLGLKTASFSQCRRLTVISKQKDALTPQHRAWDLDLVERKKAWLINHYLSDPSFLESLSSMSKGTVILWQLLDRMVLDQNRQVISHRKFLEMIREVEGHLSMVFHRFIEKNKLSIWLNGTPIKAWNPFFPDLGGNQSFPCEVYDQGKVSVTGYVLPHATRMNADQWKEAGGIRGWAAQQGFYIYRKDRILLAGDWLGLFRKDEHTKLARIMVEIDSSLDFSWQIDIRKSRAVPPKMFQDKLKRYSEEVRSRAIEVFRHRGKQRQRRAGQSSVEMGWVTYEMDGREYFKVNRKHPLVRLMTENSAQVKADLEKLLKMLEMTLPIPAIVLSESQHGDHPAASGTPVRDDEVLAMMKSSYRTLRNDGLSHEKALDELLFIEPFSNYQQLIEQIN